MKKHSLIILPALLVSISCFAEFKQKNFNAVKAETRNQKLFIADDAINRTCSKFLSMELPQNGSTIYVWLRAIGIGMEINKFKDSKVTDKGWIKFNSSKHWRWRMVAELKPGQFDKISVHVPKTHNNKGELNAAVDCLLITQEKNLDIHASEGKILEIINKRSTERYTPQILPLPVSDTYKISIGTAANIPLNPVKENLRIFNNNSKLDNRMNIQGIELFLEGKKDIFAGVWKPVSKKILKHRNVNVAQGDDKLREQVSLPENINIAVNKKFSALSFLHTVKGAGEIGDLLFKYTVNYDDNSTTIIPVREGERIGGQLKPSTISLGNEVFNNLVNYRSVSLFITSWKNPYPLKTIKSITMSAEAKKIAPVLLGLAGHKKLFSENDTGDSEKELTTVNIDFSKKIKPVKEDLLGTNVPYMLKAKNNRYFEEFRKINFSSVRIWNRCHPKEGQTEPPRDFLDKQNDYIKKMVKGTRTKILLDMTTIRRFPLEGDDLDQQIKFFSDWYMAVLDNMMSENLPLKYIEFFNEELIGHTKDAPVKYRYYNAVAKKD